MGVRDRLGSPLAKELLLGAEHLVQLGYERRIGFDPRVKPGVGRSLIEERPEHGAPPEQGDVVVAPPSPVIKLFLELIPVLIPDQVHVLIDDRLARRHLLHYRGIILHPRRRGEDRRTEEHLVDVRAGSITGQDSVTDLVRDNGTALADSCGPGTVQ